MTWLLAIALALAAFAIGAFAFRIGRDGWSTFAAALALGLAGYALQASPAAPGEPAAGAAGDEEGAWALVEERKAMVGGTVQTPSLVVADAMARRGQYENAAAILRGAVRDNPRDGEAWLALGNALVEHAGGALTEPALFAYRRASETDPAGVGPGYFLGLALIRQGQIVQARGVWAETLDSASAGAPGRAALEQRLARLDALLAGEGPVSVPR
ncbi:MAG TPA: tetratricopeptide repeat protein [Croceibacterium sp.]|nr:tetratricopeptide repeat protein [Croceibacterium sp.]